MNLQPIGLKTTEFSSTYMNQSSQRSFRFKSLEVLIVVEEGWSLISVCGGTGFLHTIGHSRRATGEHANLWKQDVVLLKAVKELVEVGTAKVGDRAQSGEKTASGQLLEVPLTDVLCGKEKIYGVQIFKAEIQNIPA